MSLRAGASSLDITPKSSLFLYGYPHVSRQSTGTHDPLLASALYLSDGEHDVMFVACDVIYISKAITGRVRQRITEAIGMLPGQVMISCSHTHSGPVTVASLIDEESPVVPPVDQEFLQQLEEGLVTAAVQAHSCARDAEIGLGLADATGIGTNRHDPDGPADLEVPVLVAREPGGGPILGVMLVCNMHPTVLHEDSTLYSADFPGMAREYLWHNQIDSDCPIIYYTGPSGNQSPRHVTRGNTFEEAERLGNLLGSAVEQAMASMVYTNEASIHCQQAFIDFPLRQFPTIEVAEKQLKSTSDRLEQLRRAKAPSAEVRSAECDWFGAEETLTLARAAASGQLEATAASCLPIEIQLIRIGQWSFIAWPGEVFIEYGIELKKRHPNTYIISFANGEWQGYLVTEEAVAQRCYESSNALFQSPESGSLLLKATNKLLSAR